MSDPDYTTPKPPLVVLKIDRILNALHYSNVPPPFGIVLSEDDFRAFVNETASWLPINVRVPLAQMKYRGCVIQKEVHATMESIPYANDRLQGPT